MYNALYSVYYIMYIIIMSEKELVDIFNIILFQAINKAFVKAKSDFCIGVLDIYGFEIFEVHFIVFNLA